MLNLPSVSFTIPYTSTFIRLSYMYQEYYAHCIVVRNDGRWDRLGVVDLY